MPTLLGLCGLDVPEECQGIDNTPYLQKGLQSPHDSVYLQNLATGWPNRSEWVGMWRGVRNELYIYARWQIPKGKKILFDRTNDPWEMNNAAGNPKFAEIEEALEARLQQWMRETNDPFDTGKRIENIGILELEQKLIDRNMFREGSFYGALPAALAEYLDARG